MTDLLWVTWRLIGRDTVYTEVWKWGMFTVIYEKSYRSELKNYRPVCMQSCLRKAIDVESRRKDWKLNVFGRKYGLGLSPSMALMDVEVVVKARRIRTVTLYLTKAYEKLNKRILLEDCERVLNKEVKDILTACLQVLKVTNKEELLGAEARIRLGFTWGVLVSTIFFLIYKWPPWSAQRQQIKKKSIAASGSWYKIDAQRFRETHNR